MSPQSNQRIEWESRLASILCLEWDLSNSDAQDEMAMNEARIDEEWAKDSSPEQAFAAIFGA